MTRLADTAADLANLAGFRADRADWAVYAEGTTYGMKGGRFELCSCRVCGGDYLRAMGVRGRVREYCSNDCKDLQGRINSLRDLVDRVADRAEAAAEKNGRAAADSKLTILKSDLLALASHSAMQSASGRRAAAKAKARRAAAAAAAK